MSTARTITASRALDDTAKWLTATAARLDSLHKRQLSVDAEWTALEIEGQQLQQLIEGLQAAAANVIGAAADLTARGPT